jgi:hypothetical protein
MQDLEQLRNYYCSDAFGGGSLFDVWEEGRAWGNSVTPSTYSPEYRVWMVQKLERYLDRPEEKCLLSIGCGNAVIECELRQRGCSVLAIDVLPPAVALARRKGIEAVLADVARWEPPHRRWDVVYADGLLGHMYEPARHDVPILPRMLSWLKPQSGVLVVSNDAPSGADETYAASGVPGFHWLSTVFIARKLEAAGYELVSTEEFAYGRPWSGTRRRAVVAARSAE